jgi:thioredoxin 1
MKIMDIASFEHHNKTIRQGITLIDYYVSWCSPCRVQATIIERVADDLKGKALIGRMNLDRHRRTAETLRIQSVPTLVVFIDGREVRRFIGLQPRETLTACVRAVIHSRNKAATV